MGFLSHIFGSKKKDSEEEEELEELEEEDEEEERVPRPSGRFNLYEGMTLDVITKEGKLLLSGRLTSQTAESLTLERLPGWISFETRPAGEEVSIRGYDNRMSQFNLTGTIEESSRVLCKLSNVQAAPAVDNQRLSFRIPMNTPAWLYRREDERYLHPESCTLVDVSTGGCCVESEYVHEEEEILRIKIKLEDYQSMQFVGQIIRASQHGSDYRYGILFAQLREDELTALTRTLYNIQVGNRREWIRSSEGQWH